MSKLVWDKTGTRFYETGTDHGVLYPTYAGDGTGQGYTGGVEWNGLTGFTESPEGAESNPIYADNIKYLNLRSAEDYKATVTAYTYPKEFAECNGERIVNGVRLRQQPRKAFGFCCRTLIGNDDKGEELGYALHLVYGATASPSEKAYSTVNDSPEAIEFSWDFDTIPVAVGDDYKPTASIEIRTTDFEDGKNNAKLKALEDILFGTDGTGGTEGTEPRLPLPEEVIALMKP